MDDFLIDERIRARFQSVQQQNQTGKSPNITSGIPQSILSTLAPTSTTLSSQSTGVTKLDGDSSGNSSRMNTQVTTAVNNRSQKVVYWDAFTIALAVILGFLILFVIVSLIKGRTKTNSPFNQ